MSSRRIVFATFGSLGDLHPYIAIGKVLLARGHRPVIATTDRYREAIEAQGIEYAPMRPAESQFGSIEAVAARLFDPYRGPEYLVRELLMPFVREQYEDISRACVGADLLVTHPLAVTGALVHAKQGVPWVSSILAPLSLLSSIDPPLLAAAPFGLALRKLGVAPYRMFMAIAAMAARRWEKPLDALHAELGLPRASHPALLQGQFSPRLNLGLFAPLLAQRQPDWPPNTVLTGFARFDGPPPEASAQAALDAFLASGPPPLVFGLGSSVVMVAGGFWQEAIAAALKLGRRAILLTGAPLNHALPAGIAAFDYLPYSAVFARAVAVVHQAGIGTLAQALAAGRPQLIVPAAFDQPDNARRAVRLSLARMLAIRKANARRLAGELALLLADPDAESAARRTADILAAEDGAARAADELLRVVA